MKQIKLIYTYVNWHQGTSQPPGPPRDRHVARIFDRGPLASEASKLRQGCGGAAPSGVKGRRPLREIFEKYGVVHDFWQ